MADRDQIGHDEEAVAELELVAVSGRAVLDAGSSDAPLAGTRVRGAVGPPVQHFAVEWRERLPGEQELVYRRVRRAMQVEDTLHEPIVVEIAAAILVGPRREVEQKIAVRSARSAMTRSA